MTTSTKKDEQPSLSLPCLAVASKSERNNGREKIMTLGYPSPGKYFAIFTHRGLAEQHKLTLDSHLGPINRVYTICTIHDLLSALRQAETNSRATHVGINVDRTAPDQRCFKPIRDFIMQCEEMASWPEFQQHSKDIPSFPLLGEVKIVMDPPQFDMD